MANDWDRSSEIETSISGASEEKEQRGQLLNLLLHDLPAQELNILIPHLQRVRLVAEQVLHESDQPVSRVLFVESGFASVAVQTSEAQQEIVVALVGREGMTGLPMLLGADTLMFNVVTMQTPGTALFMQSDALRECLTRTPILQRRLLRSFETFMAQVSQTSACIGLHRLSGRLSRWLLSASDRSVGSDLPMTQNVLGAMLASTRPAVTNAMLQLARDGIVEYGRSRIRILDRPALERASCSCYARVQALADAVGRRSEYDNASVFGAGAFLTRESAISLDPISTSASPSLSEVDAPPRGGVQ